MIHLILRDGYHKRNLWFLADLQIQIKQFIVHRMQFDKTRWSCLFYNDKNVHEILLGGVGCLRMVMGDQDSGRLVVRVGGLEWEVKGWYGLGWRV